MEKTPESEIVCLNKFYKFEFTHFLIRCICVVMILKKNTFKH